MSRFHQVDLPGLPHSIIWKTNLVQAEYVVPGMILVGAIQPNMIIAAALGAEFVFADDTDSDVKGYPLPNIERAEQLPRPEETLGCRSSRIWPEQYLEASGKYPECRIIRLFFWTRRAEDDSRIITTSMKFMGDGIFSLMMTDPELVQMQSMAGSQTSTFRSSNIFPLWAISDQLVHVGECSGAIDQHESYREFVTRM